MKTDATIAGSIPSRAEARGPQAPGHRWLADLERAWLDVQPASRERSEQGANASRSAPSGASGANAPRAVPAGFANEALARNHAADTSTPSSTERHPASADRATALERAQPVGANATSSVAIGWTGADQAVSSRTDRAAPPGAAALRVVGAPLSAALQFDTSTMPIEATSVATTTPLTSERPKAALRDVQSAEEPATQAAPEHPPEAPAYARRLLQVSGDGELQINLRDTALSASQQEAVAHALFAQMGSTGAALRRLYVNGHRYEPPDADALATGVVGGRASRAESPADPLQPHSILNDKE